MKVNVLLLFHQSSKDKALGSVKELKFTQDEESTLSNKSYKHGYKIRNAIKRKYNISKTKQICKESKKKLQDGFSSRMVQETSEYVVIKLTKEQVIWDLFHLSAILLVCLPALILIPPTGVCTACDCSQSSCCARILRPAACLTLILHQSIHHFCTFFYVLPLNFSNFYLKK